MITAFTEKCSGIKTKLINSAVVENGSNIMPVVAQWDTGATGTCISYEVVRKLNLIPIGKVDVRTPSGTGTMNRYMINLILNKEVIIKGLTVMDSCIGGQGIDILIGMDIITLGDFAVSNFQGKTYFSFRIPSQGHIEYKK